MARKSSDPAAGRPAQRRRTRKAIVDATIGLLAGGRTPTIDEIAAAADVARRTVYMHFPTLDQLLLDASAGALSEAGIEGAIDAAAPADDVRVRVMALTHAVLDQAPETLPLGRRIVALTATTPSTGEPKRGYRRLQWIEQALAPARPHLTDEQYDRIVSALTVALGWEAMIALQDTRAVTHDRERAVMAWMAETLVNAILDEPAPVKERR